jgi:oligoendopeptidase F
MNTLLPPRGIARFLLLAAPLLAGTAAAADAATPPAPPEVRWELADLYPTPEAWNAERDQVLRLADALPHWSGRLGKDAATLLQALDAISDVQKRLARLATYATLRGDEDVRIAANQERRQAAQALTATVAARTAWVAPELIAVGPRKVAQFERALPALQRRFSFFLDNTLRAKAHTLGSEGEAVMASAGEVLGQPDNVFSQFVDGEMPWTTVTLSDGSSAKIDRAAYEKLRQSANREDRKKVFDAFFGVMGGFRGTIGANLITQVLAEEFDAKVRHHPNALADATFADNMPEAVYRTLVAEANRNLPALHRYLRLRQSALGLSEPLRYYDLYPPIFSLPDPPHYDLAQMERITREVTAAYGPEYTQLLEQGMAAHWMDLYPRPGKAGGAYMNGSAYEVHPYLLFNSHDDDRSLSTFAHEWGHAVHTLLTTKNQPFEKSNYSTFIAETASIGNEMLLSDYLVDHAASDAQKLYFLGQQLELIRGTFFRQVMFAEFQLAIHEEVEKGGTLSGERMSDLYCGIARKYYGEAEGVTRIDPAYCVEWAYVPHFYYGFYVYQYATSMVGAAQLSRAVTQEGAPARARFLDMLKAGGSDYPYALYKKAGLDMATPEPYEALIARMNRAMDQIEAIRRKG